MDDNFKYNLVYENGLMSIIIEICFSECNWWEIIIGLDNGMTLNKPKAII